MGKELNDKLLKIVKDAGKIFHPLFALTISIADDSRMDKLVAVVE